MEQQNLESKLKIPQWKNYELKDWIPFYGLQSLLSRVAEHNKLPKHPFIYSLGLTSYNLAITTSILYPINNYFMKY